MEITQLAKETTSIDLACLLDAGEGAVVTLVAGDTRLVAHRAVLVDRSPVFSAMFGHDSLEASSGEVAIQDVEGPVLRQLLAFLYTLQAPQLPDIAPQLLVAADKYGVPVLKAACEQQLAEQLSVETAAAAVLLAIRHSCPSLRQAAIAYIKDHLVEVMATQGWADAVNDRPKDVEDLSRLLSESPAETSSATPTDSGTSAHQPLSGHRDDSQAPASATAASCHTPTPDEATVARLRRLPKVDKGLRLFQAAVEGAVEELEVLLVAGADKEATSGGMTALHVAANLGHVEVARRLVAHGAQVDARDSNQWTPLHWAAHSGHAAAAGRLC